MRRPVLPIVAVVVALAGCINPPYTAYRSPWGDWTCSVPTGWTVKIDGEDTHYTNVTFIGGFDPDFYLGAVSMSVRWHSYDRTHQLPDGLLEAYTSVEDYYRQMLRVVYGPTVNQDYMLPLAKSPDDPLQDINLPSAGLTGKHFIVLSPVAVPKKTVWGTSIDKKADKVVVIRQHAYVLVPMENGFYVIVYPATKDGFRRFEKQFVRIVNTFRPLKHGPAGEPYKPVKSAK